ncbi:hypothetical protein DTO166G4_96 [Paecilomyces variotii]|nr:hypothetical protein DTO166G4_96 [Paecilomyces variotii]KAJ9239809.1 hypothetical protein DTO166G5_2076 [Paecilomyces variotii]KAJ9283646.1 hypothetical protein DTO021C3_8762 [Paecilomyces variotii]KAJ9353750.1 hypothetical protein DTO027B9_5193 [Paecilomyces variotii]
MAEHKGPGPGDDPFYQTIEVDTQVTGTDSTYEDELSSCTKSVTSIRDYRQEHGRRYHSYHDGRYLLPNDEAEAQRLDMMHEMMLLMMGQRLFLAPIADNPQQVLDLGTGTGIWALDFADRYPNAEVTGTDLSPIQPSYSGPPNVHFIVDDMEDEWAFPEQQKFDFIHARFLALGIKDFPKLLTECFNNTVPGGWVEFQDWDLNMYSQDGSTTGTSIEQYYNIGIRAYEKTGHVVSPGPHLEQWFHEAGFTEIHVQKYLLPMGPWPKEEHLKSLGMWNLLQASTGFEASALAVLTRYENWTPSDVVHLAEKAKLDARDRNIHALFDFYVVYGRRPL